MHSSKGNHFTRSNVDFNKSSKLWEEALQKNNFIKPDDGARFKIDGSGVIEKIKKIKISEKKSKFQKD